REILGRADEVAGGVVDEAAERAGLVPDSLHHRIDGLRIADVDRLGADAAAELLGGLLQHRSAAAGDPDLGAERNVFRGDFLAQAGAAAGDEDALTLEKAFPEHVRSRIES